MSGDPGVSIVDVRVRPGRFEIDVRAEDDAKPGPRDIVITIKGRQRTVERAVVVVDRGAPCDKLGGTPARGRIRSLCYDRDGNFRCAVFDTDRGCLKLWSYSEAMGERVHRAAAKRFVVRVRYDPARKSYFLSRISLPDKDGGDYPECQSSSGMASSANDSVARATRSFAETISIPKSQPRRSSLIKPNHPARSTRTGTVG